jgi:hypothetical protein
MAGEGVTWGSKVERRSLLKKHEGVKGINIDSGVE